MSIDYNEIEYTVCCLPEEIPVRGNVLASGDAGLDHEAEQWVIDQLDHGSQWAWCIVRVTGEYRGLSVDAFLGGCSYKDEDDFINNPPYEDMCNSVAKQLEQLVARIKE